MPTLIVMESNTFECGCSITAEVDSEEDGTTCNVYSYDRCAAHTLTASDSGPINAWIEAYSKAHPPREIPAYPQPKLKAIPKKLQDRRAYYAGHRDQYGKYELTRLKNMLAREKDPTKIQSIMKKIEKREVAAVLDIAPKVIEELGKQ